MYSSIYIDQPEFQSSFRGGKISKMHTCSRTRGFKRPLVRTNALFVRSNKCTTQTTRTIHFATPVQLKHFFVKVF